MIYQGLSEFLRDNFMKLGNILARFGFWMQNLESNNKFSICQPQKGRKQIYLSSV